MMMMMMMLLITVGTPGTQCFGFSFSLLLFPGWLAKAWPVCAQCLLFWKNIKDPEKECPVKALENNFYWGVCLLPSACWCPVAAVVGCTKLPNDTFGSDVLTHTSSQALHGFLIEGGVGEQLSLLTAEEVNMVFFCFFSVLIPPTLPLPPPGLGMRMSLSWCVCLPLWMLHGWVEAGTAFGPHRIVCVSLVCCINFVA